MWREPLKWNRDAETLGERQRVFCCSLADVFEDWQGPMSSGLKGSEGEPILKSRNPFGPQLTMADCRDRLWQLISETPMLDWLLLTKRPENIMRMVPEPWREGFPPNVWPMTSAEDQKTANERVPALMRCPASVIGLSLEPLLGPIDLRNLTIREGRFIDCLGCDFHDGQGSVIAGPPKGTGPVGWVIVGGESGPGARPMHPDWARSLRDQCVEAGVPYFFKQWGSLFPCEDKHRLVQSGHYCDVSHCWRGPGEGIAYKRIGKHIAGRVLDGRTWDEFPEDSRGQ